MSVIHRGAVALTRRRRPRKPNYYLTHALTAVVLLTSVSCLHAQTQISPESAAEAYKNDANLPFGYKLAPIFLPRDAPGPPTVRYLSLNDHGEAAFNAEWTLFQGGYCQGGVYTNKRVVANCGDLIQFDTMGKIADSRSGLRLQEILNVQIDDDGVVYYLAIYVSPVYYEHPYTSGGSAIGTGFFIERTLVFGNNVPLDDFGHSPMTTDAQIPDKLMKGTDGRVYLFARDGSVSNDGKHWTKYKQGSGPPGLEQLRDRQGITGPENLPLPVPWQAGQAACGPVLTSLGMRGALFGGPYRGIFYNSQKQPIIAVVGSPGTKSITTMDRVVVPLRVVVDPVTVVTPAGKLLQEIVSAPVASTSRRGAPPNANVWKGMNLTLNQVDFASTAALPGVQDEKPTADRVLVNRQGQIAFRASGSDEHGRPILGVIATPLVSQNCSITPQS